MKRDITLSIPLLPPSLNTYRRLHWREQRKTEAIWKDYIFSRWLELKRPRFRAVHVTIHFHFPDKRPRDLDNYLSTGSKLVGDALKGCFIPDDSPEYLRGWSFKFFVDRTNPGTEIHIKELKNDLS